MVDGVLKTVSAAETGFMGTNIDGVCFRLVGMCDQVLFANYKLGMFSGYVRRR